MSKKIAVTMGDPSGIGPEVILKALNKLKTVDDNLILIGNKTIFKQTEKNTGINLSNKIQIIDLPCDLTKIIIGQNCLESGRLAYKCLETACEMAKKNEISAIVTAPLSKAALHMAGYNFSGQTEILNTLIAPEDEAQMLFVADGLRVLLLTRHIALKDVPKFVTEDKIISTTLILNNSLKSLFKINNPKLAICSMNPHSGENGSMGIEEAKIIIPAVNKLRKKHNILIDGPYPADGIWAKTAQEYHSGKGVSFDAYICMYHDQALIPLKLLARNKSVNMTINLPIIRTSPAHGTAFDIAGKNIANYESMLQSIKSAMDLIKLLKVD